MKKNIAIFGSGMIAILMIGHYLLDRGSIVKMPEIENIEKNEPKKKPVTVKPIVKEKTVKVFTKNTDKSKIAKPVSDTSDMDIANLFTNKPYIKKNYLYTSKALLTDQEKQDWQAILSRRENIQETFDGLEKFYDKNRESTKGEIANIERINFIHKSLELADNENEEYLLSRLESNLTAFPESLGSFSKDLKSDFIGDKVELIYIIQAYQPDLLKSILDDKDTDSRFAKIVKYASENRGNLNRFL